jgi:hypothetical protein
MFYALLQSCLPALVIAALIGWIDGRTHPTQLRLVTGWPVWLQLLLFLVAHDLRQYCSIVCSIGTGGRGGFMRRRTHRCTWTGRPARARTRSRS